MDSIEDNLRKNDYVSAVKNAFLSNLYYLGKVLSSKAGIDSPEEPPIIYTIKLLCNWCDTETLTKIWEKMSQGGGRWGNIQTITRGEPDYYVVINAPPSPLTPDMKKKTILFRMEPNMSKDNSWGEYANPVDSDFLRVFRHEKGDHNNNEWHLSKTYTQLCKEVIVKNPQYDLCLSTVLSGKYRDQGQIARINFVKFLEEKDIEVHVYGDNRWNYKNYKGSLPYHEKDNAILPYKYTFNSENNSIPNYYTEKLIDGILGESLVFYSGCYNVRDYIDSRAYVFLSLSNFEYDYQIIKRAITEDWHTQRLPYIRDAKKKILNELQFFPRVHDLINSFKK